MTGDEPRRIAMADPAEIDVDEMRRRARRRLVGAVVLALGVAVVVPMLLETEQKPLGEDVSVKIPPVDDGKFVNRLNDSSAKTAAKPPLAAPESTSKGSTAPDAATPAADRTSKYDTRVNGGATSPASASPAAAPEPAPSPPVKLPPVAAPAAGSAPRSAPAPAPAASIETPGGSSVAKPAPAASAAQPHEGFAVQLAAFADDKGANALAGRLRKGGYAAYTEPLKTSKGTLWRVRVGPYPSRDAALAARDKLKTEGHSGIVAALK